MKFKLLLCGITILLDPLKSIDLPNVCPPGAVNVTGLPAQTNVGPDVLITGVAGNGFTVTATAADVLPHPVALVSATL